MKLLAIDTSTERASIALMAGAEILSEEQDSQKTHAQLLLPMIDKLMVAGGLQLNQLDGIIFGCGPGSFTGLRIACSIAKGLAYAHDLGLVPVSSLAAIAWSAREEVQDLNAPVVTVLDARMNEMYWGYFNEGSFDTDEKVTPAAKIEPARGQSFVLAGVGIDNYWAEFSADFKTGIATRLNLFPNAAAMIRLSQHAGIKSVAVDEAQPVYVRNHVTQGDSRG